MEFPTIQELGEKVAENALDEFKYKGKTIREWADTITDYEKPSGMYQCFHCCSKSVIWDSDFDFDDYGYEGQGIVHVCHCTNCGAEIEYKIAIPDEDGNEDYGD